MLQSTLLLFVLVFALMSYATNKASSKAGLPQRKSFIYLFDPKCLPRVHLKSQYTFSPQILCFIEKKPRTSD